VFGVTGNVPLCRECAEGLKTAGECVVRPVFSAGGRSWVRCPNPVCGGVVWVGKDYLTGVAGVCVHCGTRCAGDPGVPGRLSQPDPNTDRERELELLRRQAADNFAKMHEVLYKDFFKAPETATEPPRRWVPLNPGKDWLIFEWDGEQMWRVRFDVRTPEPNPAWASPAGLREAIRRLWSEAGYREEGYQP